MLYNPAKKNMGLNKDDLLKIKSENLSEKECYQRIYDWYKTEGLKKALLLETSVYNQTSIVLMKQLPEPENANSNDQDFVFMQVLNGFLENGFHQEDSFDIKMAAYAEFAFQKKYFVDRPFENEEIKNSISASKLFESFKNN